MPVGDHVTYMRLALREARRGLGRTAPNPCVGAVIVKQGRVIATGYHQCAGTPHAEIHALRSAGNAASGSTLYVTLEPCNHYGRTPPCSHAIVAAGVDEVIIGMSDPNPLVDGSGAEYLRRFGVRVTMGVLEEQCRELNRPFIKHISTGLPWVIMKAGLTLDGRITFRKGSPGAITGAASLRRVHRLRDRCDAILVGLGTVVVDDPALTTRLPRGRGRDPVRVILDDKLHIPETSQVVRHQSTAPTWIFCGEDIDQAKAKRLSKMPGVVVLSLPCDANARLDLTGVLAELGRRDITSVVVEGGATVHGSFLRNRLVDHAQLFYAPVFAGDAGISVVERYQATDRGQAIALSRMRMNRCGADFMISGDICYPPL